LKKPNGFLRTVTIPNAPSPMDAKQELAPLGELGISQKAFAVVLNVERKTFRVGN